MEQMLQVGVISSTHGIRGEVKVFPTTDDRNRFEELDTVILDTGNEQIPLTIQGIKYFKQFVILKFREIDDINEVEKYKGKSLLVTREQAVALGEDEYYRADLIGMEVYLEDGTFFGILTEVMETGANDVYCVKTREYGEVLLPAIHQCIRQVDVEHGTMTIHLMKGLV